MKYTFLWYFQPSFFLSSIKLKLLIRKRFSAVISFIRPISEKLFWQGECLQWRKKGDSSLQDIVLKISRDAIWFMVKAISRPHKYKWDGAWDKPWQGTPFFFYPNNRIKGLRIQISIVYNILLSPGIHESWGNFSKTKERYFC